MARVSVYPSKGIIVIEGEMRLTADLQALAGYAYYFDARVSDIVTLDGPTIADDARWVADGSAGGLTPIRVAVRGPRNSTPDQRRLAVLETPPGQTTYFIVGNTWEDYGKPPPGMPIRLLLDGPDKVYPDDRPDVIPTSQLCSGGLLLELRFEPSHKLASGVPKLKAKPTQK